jgi:hypothetical protein
LWRLYSTGGEDDFIRSGDGVGLSSLRDELHALRNDILSFAAEMDPLNPSFGDDAQVWARCD